MASLERMPTRLASSKTTEGQILHGGWVDPGSSLTEEIAIKDDPASIVEPLEIMHGAPLFSIVSLAENSLLLEALDDFFCLGVGKGAELGFPVARGSHFKVDGTTGDEGVHHLSVVLLHFLEYTLLKAELTGSRLSGALLGGSSDVLRLRRGEEVGQGASSGSHGKQRTSDSGVSQVWVVEAGDSAGGRKVCRQAGWDVSGLKLCSFWVG